MARDEKLSLIKIPKALAKSGQSMHNFILDQIVLGHRPKTQGGFVILQAEIIPDNMPSFTELSAVQAAGGNFERIKFGLQLTAAAYTRNVPASLPGATYLDEKEVEQRHTWESWLKTGGVGVINRKIGLQKACKAIWGGKTLNSEVLKICDDTIGVTVLEWSDIHARFQSEEYEKVEKIAEVGEIIKK
ncbi:MAG: hypothetical protein KAR19_03780 [Bacteroidales bacterium]|nr:hypothetical protein [Bacteroidales bacterium]